MIRAIALQSSKTAFLLRPRLKFTLGALSSDNENKYRIYSRISRPVYESNGHFRAENLSKIGNLHISRSLIKRLKVNC